MTPNTDPSGLTKAALILAVSGIIGFAAVYLTFGRTDNVANTRSGLVGEQGPTEAAAPEKKHSGSMAAFVRKANPEVLPDITFKDGKGQDIRLSSFKGKTILLNLWATWCAPCREEMASLDALQRGLGSDKFEVVALSVDRQGAEASQKFLREVGAKTLKLYVDDTAKQGMALKALGLPTTILIDPEGREIGRLAGVAEWDSEEARKLIQGVLK